MKCRVRHAHIVRRAVPGGGPQPHRAVACRNTSDNLLSVLLEEETRASR